MDFYLETINPISLEELRTAIGELYNLVDYSIDSPQDLNYFTLSPKGDDEYELEFSKQEDGSYWFCTYDYDDTSLGKFTKIAAEIAEKLNCTIYDPQEGIKGISPDEFKNKERLNEAAGALEMVKNLDVEDILNNPDKYQE